MVFKKSKEEIYKGNKARGGDRIVPEFAIDNMIQRWEDVNEEVKAIFDDVIVIEKRFEAPHVKEEFHYN